MALVTAVAIPAAPCTHNRLQDGHVPVPVLSTPGATVR